MLFLKILCIMLFTFNSFIDHTKSLVDSVKIIWYITCFFHKMHCRMRIM